MIWQGGGALRGLVDYFGGGKFLVKQSSPNWFTKGVLRAAAGEKEQQALRRILVNLQGIKPGNCPGKIS